MRARRWPGFRDPRREELHRVGLAVYRGDGRAGIRAIRDPRRAEEFQAVMGALARMRRRDGAMQWRLFRDPAVPGRYVEEFMSRSWVDHLREHERLTVEDRALEEAARAFHVGGERVRVSHLVAVGAGFRRRRRGRCDPGGSAGEGL